MKVKKIKLEDLKCHQSLEGVYLNLLVNTAPNNITNAEKLVKTCLVKIKEDGENTYVIGNVTDFLMLVKSKISKKTKISCLIDNDAEIDEAKTTECFNILSRYSNCHVKTNIIARIIEHIYRDYGQSIAAICREFGLDEKNIREHIRQVKNGL